MQHFSKNKCQIIEVLFFAVLAVLNKKDFRFLIYYNNIVAGFLLQRFFLLIFASF